MTVQSKNIFIVSIIAILNFLLLIFIKYFQNNLTFADFYLARTGNIISLLITLSLLLFAALLLRKKDNLTIVKSKLLLTFSFFYILPIIVILVFNFIDFKFADEYFLGYPLKKIIPVILFVVNHLILLYVLFLLFYFFLGYSLISYLFSIIMVILIVFVLVVTTFIFTFFINEDDLLRSNSEYEYGIVLGAAVWSGNKPSPIFMGRIDKGAELYKNRVIKKIQLTGGNAPGEFSEAKTALNHLMTTYNLPLKDIFIEETTATTNEQIKFIKNNLEKNTKNKNFLIISDEFHLKRVEEMADFYNLNSKVVSSDYKMNIQKSISYRIRESIGLILFWFFAI